MTSEIWVPICKHQALQVVNETAQAGVNLEGENRELAQSIQSLFLNISHSLSIKQPNERPAACWFCYLIPVAP